MTEYLIEDPDGFLIEIDGGLLMQDDEDGYGPIETRPPAILCCPCIDYCDGTTRYNVPMDVEVWSYNGAGTRCDKFIETLIWPTIPYTPLLSTVTGTFYQGCGREFPETMFGVIGCPLVPYTSTPCGDFPSLLLVQFATGGSPATGLNLWFSGRNLVCATTNSGTTGPLSWRGTIG